MNGFFRRWQFWLGIAISALFLWLALRGLRLADVWQAIRGAQYLWLIPGLAAYWIGVWVRSWRWTYLLRPLKRISTRTAFPIVVIGYMGNNILPARTGELLRAYVLRRSEKVPISGSLATIVLDARRKSWPSGQLMLFSREYSLLAADVRHLDLLQFLGRC